MVKNLGIKTWGQLRKIKVVDRGLIGYNIETLGDFLEVGEFDCPHGRVELTDQDLYKVVTLVNSQRVVLDIDLSLAVNINQACILIDWVEKLDTLFKARGIAYKPIKCHMVVNLGLSRDLEPRDLEGNEIVDLQHINFFLKDDEGYESKHSYFFDYLDKDLRGLDGMLIDFIRSPHWYGDYVKFLYEEMLWGLLEVYRGRLAYGKPVKRIVKVLENEVARF